MAVRSGFWDSIGGDRTYSAEDMGTLFDGVIEDGVFASYGDAFRPTVTADGLHVHVGSGRAWRNHRWAWHEYGEELTYDILGNASSIRDVVVLCVLRWRTENLNRYVAFEWFAIPESSDVFTYVSSTLTENNGYIILPLFYVTIRRGQSTIVQGDIASMIGGQYCPYVTAPVQTVSTDDIRAQWARAYENAANDSIAAVQSEANGVLSSFRTSFDSWFSTITNTLSSNQAGNLANQITNLQTKFETLVQTGSVETDLEFMVGSTLSTANTGDGGKLTTTTYFTPLK